MSSDTAIAAQKAALRKTAKEVRKRAALKHGAAAAAQFATHGIAFAGAPPAVVSGYVPIGDEANIMELLRALHAAGHQLALPVIIEKGKPLEFRSWSPGDRLEVTQWGIREPAGDAAVVAPDIVLSPLLAFDAAGYRLGYGGGFYDRSLAELGAQKQVVSIGIAFDEQRVDAVPRDAYDQRLDWILTPSGATKFG